MVPLFMNASSLMIKAGVMRCCCLAYLLNTRARSIKHKRVVRKDLGLHGVPNSDNDNETMQRALIEVDRSAELATGIPTIV
jgi:hypothetical protein